MAGKSSSGPRTSDGRWGILLGASALVLVAVACVDALIVSDVAVRLAVLVCAVGIIAERSADARTAIGAAVMAWPIGNGFLENQAGVLSWHTATDFPFALGLLGAVAVGMCVAQARITRTAWRRQYLAAQPRFSEERGGSHPLRKYQDLGGERRSVLASGRDIYRSQGRSAFPNLVRRTHRRVPHIPLKPTH